MTSGGYHGTITVPSMFGVLPSQKWRERGSPWVKGGSLPGPWSRQHERAAEPRISNESWGYVGKRTIYGEGKHIYVVRKYGNDNIHIQ